MIAIFSTAYALHDPPHEMLDGVLVPAYESPARAEVIHTALQQAALGPILPPRTFGTEPIRATHSDDYLAYLEHAYDRWVAAGGSPAAVLPGALAVRWMQGLCEHPLGAPGYYAFDLSAPIVAGTYAAARAAADVALTGAALLQEGERAVYTLCRPPGHHAGRDMCGGYCYLNNAAIAAEYLLQAMNDERQTMNDGQGASTIQRSAFSVQPSQRVAILDIDYHHGNGTQQIFYERDDVLFVSLHADPARQYPYFSGYADERGQGAGLGYNLNIPLETGVTTQRFLSALDVALATIADFAPRFLVLSAGFDTFEGDPIGDFALNAGAYPSIGQRIAALNLPTLIVQEGGYAVAALGENVVGLLRGFASA